MLEARKNKNKKDVCVVLRVDKDNMNVDLSRKKIKNEKKK